MKTERLSKEQALQKLRHFCAYQERCHQEVKEKAYGFGLHKAETEELLSRLIEDNYLDEERFAIQFAGGKFRMKHWGKRKIEAELKARHVSSFCIRKGLAQIPEEDYWKALSTLTAVKFKGLENENDFTARGRVTAYLLQKGFEPDLIAKAIDAFDA